MQAVPVLWQVTPGKKTNKLAQIDAQTVETLKSFLPSAANFYNPVDVLGDALADRYRKTFEIILKDTNVNAMMVLLTPQAMTQELDTAKAWLMQLKIRKKIPVIPVLWEGMKLKKALII